MVLRICIRTGSAARCLALGGDAVASLFLGAVERTVGTLHEAVHRVARAVPCGDAKAHCDAAHPRLDRRAQFFAEHRHLREVVMEGEEDELVAAVADEDVAAVDARLYDLGDAAQRLFCIPYTVYLGH